MNVVSRAVSQQWAHLKVGASKVGVSMMQWSRQLVTWTVSSLRSVENFVSELSSWIVVGFASPTVVLRG